MVRSKWMMSLAAAVASTGLALGQQSELITIAEPGKPAHKCKVIETYKKPDGTQVYKVKDLETGEVFPVEESKGADVKQTGATESAEPAALAPVAATPAPTQPSSVGKVITVTEAGKPPQKASIVQTWKMPDGLRAFQVKTLDGGEMMTIVETGATTPTTPGASVRAMTTRIFHWGRNNVSPAEAPLPPVTVAQTAPPPVAAHYTQNSPPPPVASQPAPARPAVQTVVMPSTAAPAPMTIPASGANTVQTTQLPAAPVATTNAGQYPVLPPVKTTSSMVEVKPVVEPAQPKDCAAAGAGRMPHRPRRRRPRRRRTTRRPVMGLICFPPGTMLRARRKPQPGRRVRTPGKIRSAIRGRIPAIPRKRMQRRSPRRWGTSTTG